MPKAPVYEDNGGESTENDVRRARQRRTVQPKAEAQAVENSTYGQFRSGILPANFRHQLASALLC